MRSPRDAICAVQQAAAGEGEFGQRLSTPLVQHGLSSLHNHSRKDISHSMRHPATAKQTQSSTPRWT